jgi:hypothetical protein
LAKPAPTRGEPLEKVPLIGRTSCAGIMQEFVNSWNQEAGGARGWKAVPADFR